MRALCLALLLALFASSASSQPNIIVILADDLSQEGVSTYGPGIAGMASTPNIDSIADAGVKFTQSFVTYSLCAPSRAAQLTGKTARANGLILNNTVLYPFDINQQTVVDVLKANGYDTAIVGKLHLGVDPHTVGFDYYNTLAFTVSGGPYHNTAFTNDGAPLAAVAGYVTENITTFATNWLTARGADPDPFALFIWYTAPHDPVEPKAADLHSLDAITLPHPPSWEDRSPRALEGALVYPTIYWGYNSLESTIGYIKWLAGNTAPAGLNEEQRREWIYQAYTKDMLLAIKGVDDSVGDLLSYLDTNGLTDNTIILFTSDNGFLNSEHGKYGKILPYEPVRRIPLLIQSPGEITPGTTDSRIALEIDLAPTMLAAASIAIPADMQGRSLLGAVPEDWRTSAFMQSYSQGSGTILSGRTRTPVFHGVFAGDKTLVEYHLGGPGGTSWGPEDNWLIDRSVDPYEMSDVYENPKYHGAGAAVPDLTCQIEQMKHDYGITKPTLGVKLRGNVTLR